MARNKQPGRRREAGTGTLAQAQAILAQAADVQNEKRVIALAREALAVCPDCADAYVLLAEHSPNQREALDLYERAVAAGKRAIGGDDFEAYEGHFWDTEKTRSYLRARLGLARRLWAVGRHEEAVEHYQELLYLDVLDHQGVRSLLACCLLSLGQDDDLADLLTESAADQSAVWAYSKALLAFRRHGATLASRQALQEAREINQHVPGFLLAENVPPPGQPGQHKPGDEGEALNYVGTFLAAWQSTPGAIAWLRAST
jgi:tetratricopeptide (TPR) repeat protein